MKTLMERAIDLARMRGAQYADIRIVQNLTQNIIVKDGVAEAVNSNDTIGFGVRVFAGGSWGFASSRDVSQTKSTG